MRKDRRVGLLCAILSLSMFLSCLSHVVRAKETEIPCYSVTEGLSYEVSVSESSSWDTHANIEYVLTNTGDEIIHNWYLTLDLPYQIEGIWNAYVFETNGPDQEGKITYTIKNAEWNQDLQPGASVSFGMTVASLNGQPVEIKNISTFYLLNTCEKLIDPSSYTLTYQEYSNWGTGYNGGLFLTNTSSETIEDWRLSFESNRSINELSGVAFKPENEKIQITNAGNNQNLYSYATQNLTVNGTEKNTNESFFLSNVTLTAITCAYTLTEDNDYNGIADYIDFIQAEIEKNKQDEETEVTPEPTETPVPTAEPTEVPEITEIPDVTATPEVTEVPFVTEAPTSTPTPEVTVVPTPEATPTPDPLLDSDEDGIPDYYEAQLGTDPYSQDSDGDHIDDAVEMLMGLDPLSSDTDEDGIPDDQEDDDGDGLTLLQELEIGTYTWTDDSDWDGISDGDEVNIYGTDPTNPDSDEDGISDGDELKLGTDPLSKDSDNDGIPDGQEKFLQTRTEAIQNEERPVVNQVEVTLEGTGCLDSAMTIKDVYGIETYTSDMMGLVGVQVEFEYEGEFDEATLTFHYDPEALASTHPVGYEEIPWAENYTTRESSLGILYYDEESGMFVDCDATVDTVNHTVSCTTTHFSIYIVADVSLWYQWWASMKYVNEMRPSHEGYDGIDYVLEIPCVTSMTSADIAQMNAIAYLIIGNMQENDRMAVSGYNSSGYYHYGYTNDKELLRRQVTEWPWNEDQGWLGYGGTTVSTMGSILSDKLDALEIFNVAVSHWGRDENNELVAIAFNNSTDIDCWFYSTSFRAKTDMTAYIFTLSSGDPNTPAMKWLNLTAGGGVIDCEGKSAKEVYDEYAELYELRQGVDNDPNEYSQPEGDGLWDIYEEQGMLASNGRIYYSDPRYKDSDTDTLTDAQEMGKATEIDVTSEGELFVNGELLKSSGGFGKHILYLTYQPYIDYGEGTWNVYQVKSDPRKKNTDNDDATDEVDATPNCKNIEVSYLLYDDREGADWFLEYEAFVRKSMDEEMILVPVENLIQEWNRMGENQDGKQLYDIDTVILIFHGNEESVGSLDIRAVTDESVCEKKRIRTLILSSCNTGKIDDYKNNIAYSFMSWGTIDEVYAWNGRATFIAGFNGFLINDVFEFQFTIEFSPDKFQLASIIYDNAHAGGKALLSGDFGGLIGSEIQCIVDTEYYFAHLPEFLEEMPNIGRVRYYRNENNEIVWEKVSDWSFMCSVFSC